MVKVEAMLSAAATEVVAQRTAAAGSPVMAATGAEIRAAAEWETCAHSVRAAPRIPSAVAVVVADTAAAERVHNCSSAEWASPTEAAEAAAVLARRAPRFQLTQRAPRIHLLAGMDRY
jgi:hypothetical protein